MSSQEITAPDMGEDSHAQEPREEIDSPDEADVDLSAEQPGLEDEVAPEDDSTEEEPVATEGGATEEKPKEIDEEPAVTKESIAAEIAELEKKREELKKKTELEQEKYVKWRDAGRDARAARFQQREPQEPPEPLPEGEEEERPPTTPRPQEDDFENYNDYVDALTDWKVEQKLVEYDRRTAEKAEEDQLTERQAEFREKFNQGFEKYPDFEEIALDNIVPITPFMADVLTESDIPADVAYYLGQNLKEATAISNMSPIQAVKALGIIEDKLKAKMAAEETRETPTGHKPKPKPTSQAPAPITPVSGGGSVVKKDPSKMTNEEYRQWRLGKSAG